MAVALGMLELSSIGKGIETADIMIKASSIEIMFAKHVCIGKFLILISGDIGSVNESMAIGIENGNSKVVDSFIIPNIHEDILFGLRKRYHYGNVSALGTMELSSVSSGIMCLDTVLKSGFVKLIKLVIANSIGGKCYFLITGDISSVSEALNAGEAGINSAKILSKIVIPSPEKELIEQIL
ncbi:BMC domain-containing protein [Clostridium sediminicola]|uniref:BMC domain-containing protein n=1 Tax=Clostridium sediminicola TaxID=3114879 RepID=UPI0031F24AE9